jgi:hypothetical protein
MLNRHIWFWCRFLFVHWFFPASCTTATEAYQAGKKMRRRNRVGNG